MLPPAKPLWGRFLRGQNRKSRRNRCVNPSQPKNRNVFLVFLLLHHHHFCAGHFSRASRKGQRDPLCRYANMSWYPIICFSSKSITSLALSTSPAPSANTEDGEFSRETTPFRQNPPNPRFLQHLSPSTQDGKVDFEKPSFQSKSSES